MTRLFTCFFFFLLGSAMLSAQKTGYQIKVKIEGFQQKEAYLGYYMGDKQYLKDTAYLDADGWFYFEGNEDLAPGIHLIVMPPDNEFFQLLVDKSNQWFSVETKLPNTAEAMKVKDSPDNQLFYDYMRFLTSKRPEADELRKQIEAAKEDPKKKEKLDEKLKAIDTEVVGYQQNIVTNNASTLTAAIIRANMPLEVPKFEGEQTERDRKTLYWSRDHWFDHIDLGDPRMLRSPFLFSKVDHFVQKMFPQHPDSLIKACDIVLEKSRPSEETFRYFLTHFLNLYAKSSFVGMDAVYVHLGDKYYCKGQASWVDAETLEKICDNVNRLKPLLIGKIAPDIEMETQSGERMTLHGFKSPWTVLFFWDPTCSHCKKSMPEMVQFAKDYKDKGVSIFAICTKLVTRDDQGNISLKEVDSCWDFVKEKEMDVFFNAVDPYHRSRYKTLYDIKTTPQIYVLDEHKKILSKRIGSEQLTEVLNHIIEVKKKEEKQ